MIVHTDRYDTAPRISREGFRTFAFEQFGPQVLAERDPGEYWDAIVARGCDPLYILAIFKHECNCGKDVPGRDAVGVARHTKSWGNTRKPDFGATPIGVYKRGPGDEFSKWATWLDGCISTVARLMTDEWYYHGEKRNIGQVYNDPVANDPSYPYGMAPVPRKPKPGGGVWRIEWAPAYDSNDPNNYLGKVLTFMNRYQDMASRPPLINMFDHTPIIDTSQIIPASKIERLGNFPHAPLRQLKYLTFHETGNLAPGANAQMHRNFVENGGGEFKVSYQYTSDKDTIIQIVDDLVACWHAGNNVGNFESIACEICINSLGAGDEQGYYRTLYNTAYWAAVKQKQYNIVVADKRQHHQWSGKDCPHYLRARGEWEWFLQGIEDWRQKLDGPRKRYFPSGFYLTEGFLAFYERAEESGTHWSTIGEPISNEIPNVNNGEYTNVTVQKTDVGYLQWTPATNEVRMAKRTQAKAIDAFLGNDAPPEEDPRIEKYEKLRPLLFEANKIILGEDA